MRADDADPSSSCFAARSAAPRFWSAGPPVGGSIAGKALSRTRRDRRHLIRRGRVFCRLGVPQSASDRRPEIQFQGVMPVSLDELGIPVIVVSQSN
jgi:hypothetical protein